MQGMTTRRPTLFGAFTATAGVATVIAGLAVIDSRVRDQIGYLLAGHPPTEELVSVGARAQDLLTVVLQAVRDQSIANAPLVIFGVAALVLVVFMTRT